MINRTQWPKFAIVMALLALVLSGCAGAAAPTSWAGLTVKDGVAYVTVTGQVVAIDTADGDVRWTFDSQLPQQGLFGSSMRAVPVHTTPAVDGDLVFVGSDGQPRDEGRVRALDIESGQVIWQFPPADQAPIGNIFGGLVVQDGVLYFGSVDQVYALEAETGAKLWSVPVGGRVWSTPLLVEGKLYVSTLNHKLVVLDLANEGQVAWTFDQSKGALVGSPVSNDDTLYVGSFDKHLYAIDVQTREQRWAYTAANWLWDGLTVVSDTAYLGDLGGYVYAINTQDGRLRWSQPAEVKGAVRAAPLYTGDLLIVATDLGNIYALDPADGSVRWAANAAGSKLLTGPVVDNGKLILATLDGPVKVYGVDLAKLVTVYQQQEIKAEGRAPVMLYKEGAVNTDVVSWYFPLASSK